MESLEEVSSCSNGKIFPLFMEYEGSFPCSQEPTTGAFILTGDLKDFLNLEAIGLVDSSQFSEC
jgi:hypothetical protein